ncbi:hypothetical protein [Rubritalea sp.]|uniref:hypothetical protein n=1 Tax=Rubritalea sp. TaxID=2109375 RepID=UPI003EF90D51
MIFKFLIPSLLCGLGHLAIAQENIAFGSSAFETGFVGNLYDLKQDEEGKPTEVGEARDSKMAFYEAFKDLIRKGFSDKSLSEYRMADEANELKYLIVPRMKAEEAPTVFGSSYIDPKQVIIVYKGVIKKAPSKSLRFAGVFDDAMCVLVNGKLVFYVSRHEDELRYKPADVSNRRKESKSGGLDDIAYGEYIELKKGDELTLVAAEIPGGGISGKLLVQLERGRYQEDSFEDPKLPPFFCGDPSREDLATLKSLGVAVDDIPEFEFERE